MYEHFHLYNISLGYELITKKGCEPLHSCLADDIPSKSGCEAACTALHGCMGYQFPNAPVPQIGIRIGCILVPMFSEFTLKTCPNEWKLIFTGDSDPYEFSFDLRELEEGNLHMDCYRKTWSKKC